eukprot:TRINITY_DN5017_c0_g1_i1.p1 TRINITY_DN5017_c0_g1~~TRINITY_DN5017_c0_g1_i1.p1  ORF type:complete len:315 (-),score=61.05 TRINITY_DN5017_c0_g1_i1:149-1093(-)
MMTLQVQIKAGKGLTKSDAYCVCNAGDIPTIMPMGKDMKHVKTDPVSGNLDPQWDFTGNLEWDGSEDLTFSVWDRNSASKSMGKVSLAKGKVTCGFSGTLPLDTKGTIEVAVLPCVLAESRQVMTRTSSAVDLSDLWSCDLLMWQAPAKSALVLGLVDFAFLLYFFFAAAPLQVVTTAGFVCIGLGGISNIAGLQASQWECFQLSEVSIKRASRVITTLVQKMMVFVWAIVSWESQSATVKVLCLCYFVNKLPSLGISRLALLVFNLALIVPIQMKVHEVTIATRIEPQILKFKKKKAELVAKIPKYSDAMKSN